MESILFMREQRDHMFDIKRYAIVNIFNFILMEICFGWEFLGCMWKVIAYTLNRCARLIVSAQHFNTK